MVENQHFTICIHISLSSGEIYIYIYNTFFYKLPVSILCLSWENDYFYSLANNIYSFTLYLINLSIYLYWLCSPKFF